MVILRYSIPTMGSSSPVRHTDVLKDNLIQISMDGKGYYRDNIFVERLWRTVKYEHLYTREFANVGEVRESLSHWFEWITRNDFIKDLIT